MVWRGMRVVVGRRRACGREDAGGFCAIVAGFGADGSELDAAVPARPAAGVCAGALDSAGAEHQLGLRWWSRRRGGRRLIRQAHALQISTDRGGLGEAGDHAHASAAAIAGADVDGRDPRQQDSPRESLRHVMVTRTAVLAGRLGGFLLRHDLVAVAGAGAGCEDAVIADEIDARRGHEGGRVFPATHAASGSDAWCVPPGFQREG